MFKSILLNKDIKAVLFIAIVTLLAFYPLMTGQYALKWDATFLNLTWKNFITKSILEGRLPLWGPYMNGGFPLMGDPGTWYPISWLFGVGGYTLW